MKRFLIALLGGFYCLLMSAQINTDRVITIGRNALYFEDYVLSIQYFNQAIKAKPYLPQPYFYRALAKFYLDDIKGAEDDCTLALDRNPFMVMGYQLRGDARQALKNYTGALEDYNKALQTYPNDKFILINIGIANMQLKDYEKSEVALDDLVQKHPKYTQAYLARGAMMQEKGDTVKAFENIDKAIELDTNLGQAYSMRGILYYQKKDLDKALADLNEAIKLEPDQVGNYINRGLVRYSQNNLRGSMEDYDKVIALDSENTIARFNRGLLRGQVGDDNRAIEDFDHVIKYEPNNFIAFINRALTKEKVGDYKGSLQDLNVVLEEYPEFYQGFYTRANIKRKQNDLKGAERDYNYARNEEARIRKEVANRKDPDEKTSYEKTREKSDKSIDKFDLLVIADKTEEEVTSSKYESKYRGRIQNRQIDIMLEPRFVISYYEKAMELNRAVHFSKLVDDMNHKQLLSHKQIITNSIAALNEFQIEEHFRSIDEISQKIVGDEHNAELYYARAMEYMLIQDFTNCIEDLKKAIGLDSKFVLAYFNLAIAYTKQLELKENDETSAIASVATADQIQFGSTVNQKDKSLKVGESDIITNRNMEHEQIFKNYTKVIELAPEFPYSYYNRAEIRYSKNDFRSAILDYNEVIRLNPEFAEAYYNRGLARFYLKDEVRALDDMRKAGELGITEAYSIIKRIGDIK